MKKTVSKTPARRKVVSICNLIYTDKSITDAAIGAAKDEYAKAGITLVPIPFKNDPMTSHPRIERIC